MHDDDLKALWRAQSIEPAPSLPDEAQIAAMKTRVNTFDRTIQGRDYLEIAASIFIGIYFGWNLIFRHNSLLTQAGCIVLIASSIFISWKIVSSKRRLPKAEPNAPLIGALKVELQKVENQIGLLKSVAWWYLLPLFVGVMMCYWGGPGSLASKLTYFMVVLAVYLFIYWLNQRAVKKSLLPLKQELASLLHSAETGEPFAETQCASVRQLGRSTLATEQFNAAEFKVAFWQIALHGEIGFVGIWFFGMLAWTNFNVPRMFTPPHLAWIVPAFLAGLVYSRMLQRTTERAVGISRLGVHLNKGQNLVLWNEISEVRPFRLLNIRSLWLIGASGEKTIMAWSSLERQSELKAAVEACAPANHPIRGYLSLLRPESRKRSLLGGIVLVGIMLISFGAIVWIRGKQAQTPVAHYPDPTSQLLENIRVKHKFPALAAAVVVDGKIVTTNAVGFRMKGGPEAVTVDDKFHLGSVTKSMTATVAAMLVEQQKISWTTTIGELFPELGDKLHPDYRGVTLEQLLAHRGGAPGSAPPDLWGQAWVASGTAAEQRLEFVKGLLARAPEAKPGTKHIYSNQGYAIAGVMLEKATGKSWEELMRTMLFEPLGMTSAGFGAPATPGKVDQPWGHTKGFGSGFVPVPPGPSADNPAAIGPAGTVHCSLADLAKYAVFHLTGEQGGSKLLKADSFKKLHTSAGDDYALGWVVLERKWAGGRALMHNGSNTMFYVVVWLAPDLNSAVIVATNVGSDSAFGGCDEAAVQLIKQFFPK